ncbi:MAG TPA: hypothetical protein VJ738_01950 [Steroidobacteraceae bacterium]|nr:hypothetical protein [Steroidobacteraceae bacterium]
MSPSLSLRVSLLLRSERYRRLDAQPEIRARTDFFAAAAIVTRALAYSGATPFMLALSDALEGVNVCRAHLIRSGCLYVTGSVERNTRDFIRYEQALVQAALDHLRGSDPRGYSEQIRVANGAIARALRPGAGCASNALTTFARAAECCLARLGRAIEFATQSDREALGEELARSARRGPGWRA